MSDTPKEDLQQELYLHCLKKLDNYDPERGRPRTYLNKLLRRKSRDLLRRAKIRRAKVKWVSLETWLESTSSDDQLPDQYQTSLEQEDLRIDLEQALELLSVQSLWLLLQLRVEGNLASVVRANHLSFRQLARDLQRLRFELRLLGLDNYLK